MLTPHQRHSSKHHKLKEINVYGPFGRRLWNGLNDYTAEETLFEAPWGRGGVDDLRIDGGLPQVLRKLPLYNYQK